jgi:hypothetical protein
LLALVHFATRRTLQVRYVVDSASRVTSPEQDAHKQAGFPIAGL